MLYEIREWGQYRPKKKPAVLSETSNFIFRRYGRKQRPLIVRFAVKERADQIAGACTPGNSSDDIRLVWIAKGTRQLGRPAIKVKRPRLRHKEVDEVSLPAYDWLQENSATAGISRRSVSRQPAASAKTWPKCSPCNGCNFLRRSTNVSERVM